jgi:hypothetical protein
MTLRDRIVFGLTVAAAACAAAVAAHVAIDLAGDVALAHDPYDDIGHASRGNVAGLALALVTALLLRLVWHALLEARGDRTSVRASLARVTRNPLAFVAAVNCATLPVLAAMGAADSLAAAGRVAPLLQLVGGSLGLCVAIAVPIASAAALFVWCGLRLLQRSCDALVDALGAIVAFLTGPSRAERAIVVQSRYPSTSRAAAYVGGSAGKRAPPLFA